MSAARWSAAAIGVLAAGLLAAVVVAAWGDSAVGQPPMSEPRADAEVIARGAYLASMGDCAACHSVPGKPAFSGGLRMAIPIGAIYTTNITPDPKYGIGQFTLADFDRALRFGVAEGHTLYPAMPFTSYANTRPEDVEALYAYFKYGVASAPVPNEVNDIAFPLSMRWPLTYWRWMFAPTPRPFTAPVGVDPRIARGAYFVDGLGHCGECHTPRALTMQVKATNAADGADYLSGALIEGYFAPSLRSGGKGTLAEWTVDDLAEFLRTGSNSSGTAFGSMTEVIAHSTQHMTPGDAVDTARYLKSITDPGGEQARFAYDKATDAGLRTGADQARGARVYLDNCAACHRPDGKGYDHVFPPLSGNPIVLAPNPDSVVSVVLKGATTPRTASTPAQFAMPSFAWRLSDEQVADVVTFVRHSWGNDASQVDARTVSSLRPRELRQASN
jgi:mono/diheme cytochrome c family protein